MIKMNTKGLVGILIIIILAVAIVIGIILAAQSAYATYKITGTPTSARLVPTGDSDRSVTYVVWLTTGQKLEIQRSPFFGDNEDDTYNFILNHLNQTMTFTCWGWQVDNRILGIYWYPNIGHAQLS